MPQRPAFAFTLLVLLPAASAQAGVFNVLEPDTDYTLFHPTPRSEMREEVNELSPQTVDAGHAQVNLDVVSAAWGSEGGASSRDFELFGFEARLGLTGRTDLQVHWVPYADSRVMVDGQMMKHERGIGDTTVALGLNLWGNDGGATALGLQPFVRLPSGTGGVGSGAFEGGVRVPMEIELPADTVLALAGQMEFADDVHGRRGVHPRLAASAAIEKAVVGPVWATVEWTATADAEGAIMTYQHELLADGTVQLGRDLQVSAGACLAMPDIRAGINPYVSVAYRR